MQPLFAPTDCKVAILNGTALAGGASATIVGFNASKIRYLLAFAIANITAAAPQAVSIDDPGGNPLGEDPSATNFPYQIVLPVPLVCGLPGANGLLIHNRGAVADTFNVCVWYADVDAKLVKQIFQT